MAINRSRAAHKSQKQRCLLSVESLEDRRVLATMSVTTLLDAGPGSLRDAIESANAEAGLDRIEFDASLSGGIIQLQSELVVTDSITLNPDFVDIAISGADADPTPGVADGAGIRLFHFAELPLTAAFVPSQINGVTLTGGDITGSGGAILARHGIVLSEVNVESNAATEHGGGVYLTTQEGSGFGISDSRFVDNFANLDGGAVKLINNPLGYSAVERSEFRGNEANRGGALDIETNESFTLIADTMVDDNEAQLGGGVNVLNVEGGITQIERTTISNNYAVSGGGLATLSNGFGFMVVFDVEVVGNATLTDSGGALIVSRGGRADSRVANSTFSHNEAGLEGGGLTLSGSNGGLVGATNLTVRVNHSDYTGGGLRLLAFDDSRVSVVNSRVSGNHGLNGGGVEMLVGSDSYTSIFNTAVYNNSALFDGGGVNVEAIQLNARAAITNSTISGNEAGRSGGGVNLFANRDNHEVVIQHSTIADNVANLDPTREGTGGGINGSFFSSTHTMTHSIVANNQVADGDTMVDSDLAGEFSANYSLVETLDSGAAVNGTGNIVGVDPQLSVLADNGGRSKTHAIARTSPAYNAGQPNEQGPFSFDQRSLSPFDRVQAGRIDIGAFELGLAPSGDFDGNSAYNCADIDGLVEMVADGTYSVQFDLNSDAVLDGNDVQLWLAAAGEVNLGPGRTYLVGDADLNGVVDISDFNIWNRNKFTESAGWCSGDFSADGLVDVQDFNLWNTNRFQSSLRLAGNNRLTNKETIAIASEETTSRAFTSVAPVPRSTVESIRQSDRQSLRRIDNLFAESLEVVFHPF